MKTWFSNIFGEEQKPPSADGDAAIAPMVTGPAPGLHVAPLPLPSSSLAEWTIGQQVTSEVSDDWQYKVRDIKRGGFGIAYIVSDREGNPLVLKTMHGQFGWHEEDRCRFEREIVTWLRLGNHPRIVRAITLDRVEGRPVLVMEYMPGGSVSDQIMKDPLDLESALKYGLDICEGMAYAHSRLGLVHLDLKPANCLLTNVGRLRIADFGLAKILSEFKARKLGIPDSVSRDSALTSTPIGTKSYMPPEQFERGAELDTRVDVYSFGVMLFEMLTTELPYVGTAAQELVQQSEAGRTLPGGLRDLILTCVDPSRDRRPADFQQVLTELSEDFRRSAGKEPPQPERVPVPNLADQNLLGLTYLQLGYTDEAIRFFDDGLDLSPLNQSFLTNKATALRKSGRLQEALQCYKRALEVGLASASAWGNLAQLFVEMDSPSAALGAVEKGLALAPDNLPLIGNKALVLFKLGRSAEALALNEAVLATHPKNGRLLTARGDMLFELGRHREALDCFDRALAVDPLNCEAWELKALSLLEIRDFSEAARCAKRSVELRPTQQGLQESRT